YNSVLNTNYLTPHVHIKPDLRWHRTLLQPCRSHQHLSLGKPEIRPVQNVLSLGPQRRYFPGELEELDHQRVQLLSEKVLASLSDVSSLPESNKLHPSRTGTRQDIGHLLVVLPAFLRKPLLDCCRVYPLQLGLG